jgi:hypothetical protein
MTLTKWLDMKLEKFDGSGTPMDASSWLRNMERYMGASVMTPEDKVVYVAFQLKVSLMFGGKEFVQLGHRRMDHRRGMFLLTNSLLSTTHLHSGRRWMWP